MTKDTHESTIEKEIVEKSVQIAPQDILPDPTLLPESTIVIGDEQVVAMFKFASSRPGVSVYSYDVVIDIFEEYTPKQLAKVLAWVWGAIKPGYSLFIDPAFPVKPDVIPEHRKVEGYKKYTKGGAPEVYKRADLRL